MFVESNFLNFIIYYFVNYASLYIFHKQDCKISRMKYLYWQWTL